MRMRTIAASMAVVLAVIGVAMAQQASPPAADRAELRARIIKLRVEIELLQLDHDDSRSELLQLMEEIREAEGMGPEELQEKALASMMLLESDRKALLELMEEKGEKGVADVLAEAEQMTMTDFKARRDRKKKEYARQAEELAGKRLDLEAMEREYLR